MGRVVKVAGMAHHHTITTVEQIREDELFARRLQRAGFETEDQGLLPNRDGTIGFNIAEAQQRSNTQAIRVNVLQESLREVTSSRVALSALFVVNVPQVGLLQQTQKKIHLRFTLLTKNASPPRRIPRLSPQSACSRPIGPTTTSATLCTG